MIPYLHCIQFSFFYGNERLRFNSDRSNSGSKNQQRSTCCRLLQQVTQHLWPSAENPLMLNFIGQIHRFLKLGRTVLFALRSFIAQTITLTELREFFMNDKILIGTYSLVRYSGD